MGKVSICCRYNEPPNHNILSWMGATPLSKDETIPWFLVPYLDANGDGKVSVVEFVDKKMTVIMRSIFNGFDRNKDGRIDMSEATLESLLNVRFIQAVVKEAFDLLDVDDNNLISLEDVPRSLRDSEGEHRMNWTRLEDICEGVASRWEGHCKTFFFHFFPLTDTNGDGVITLEELEAQARQKNEEFSRL